MTEVTLPASASGPLELGKHCGVCQTPIQAGEEVGRCPRCDAPHHAECWAENGGCATYACPLGPVTVKERAELPESHWGQEEKVCPGCGERIKVAALRCRYCGLVFKDRSPHAESPRRISRRVPLVIFLAGILPPTAPLALAAGGLWALFRRRELRRLVGFDRVLLWVGLGCAAIMTLILIAVLGLGVREFSP